MTPKTGEQHVGENDIAVVGMSCRLPGAANPAEFWELLRNGRQSVTRQEDGTWRAALDGHGEFDSEFFAMSAAQAAATDPQQRLVLELGWEALEHAGIVPARLSGTRTGVYVAIASDDYATLAQRTEAPMRRLQRGRPVPRHGRQPPLLPPRTARPQHGRRHRPVLLARRRTPRLRKPAPRRDGTRRRRRRQPHPGRREHLPHGEHGGALPDGRCHTFDARANGYVRGEGGAAVVLKPLRRALADGDPVHAVIKGGAVNNDGGGPSLTTPDRAAQEAVLREAYERAGVRPGDVRFVELHGTGTRAGDPVEAAALGAVLGTARTGSPSPSAPPRPTSATSKAPPDSSACSRPCSPSAKANSRRASTTPAPTRTSRSTS